MDKDFALGLSSQIGIDVQQIVREEVELIVLKRLFESTISSELVFKGGTALRLIYNSPRFSNTARTIHAVVPFRICAIRPSCIVFLRLRSKCGGKSHPEEVAPSGFRVR